jgi:hypothetical protein
LAFASPLSSSCRYNDFVVTWPWPQALTLTLSLSLSFVQSHQNPPAIPSMVIVYIVCKLRGAKLVIDWHNFGYRCVVCVSCVSCAVVCGCRVWVRCSTAC